MLNTCITSTISLRTRGSPLPFSTNDYAHCSNEAHPFFYSSSSSCCCCCCSNPMYKVPLTPNYCYNLYGLRQSSLIQWSPYRRLIGGSFDRCSYYARLPAGDVGGDCDCNRVRGFQGKNVGGRKRGLRRCMVFDEMSERFDVGGVDEAEVLLSLLTEDVDEECFYVKRETRKLVKKPVVPNKETGKISNKVAGKKKRVGVGVVESEPRCENKPIGNLRKKDDRRREKVKWSEEEKEGLLREENRRGRKDVLTNQTLREKEESEALLRKRIQKKADEKQETESMSTKENSQVSSRTEDRENLLRREEQRQKVMRDGSSCSSYYSFSSTGDYESENETELREGRFLGDSSSGLMSNSSSGLTSNSSVEIVRQNAREEDQRRGTYREDNGGSLTKKSTEKEFGVGSSVVESDFRKKSEKKLTDTSVEEMESRKKSSIKESKISTAHESNYEHGSDRKVKSSENTEFDEERKQQLVQTGDEDSRLFQTRQKYKQSDDIRNSYGSQKLYSGKSEVSAKVASQEKVGEMRSAVGMGTREDKYERNSRKVSEVSETQEIDIRKTSISQQRFETNVKEEDHSTNILSSDNDEAKQKQQYGQVSGLLESRGTSQNLTNKTGKSILKTESDKPRKEQDKLNLAYGSALESKQTRSQTNAKIINVGSRNESDELITHSENSGATFVDNRNKTKSEAPARPSSNLPETGVLSVGPMTGSATDDGVDESSQFDSTEVHGQPSKFFSHEDAIGSAARFEKSSAHYIGEFVSQVTSQISSSEIQKEKKTNETKLIHEEQHHRKEHDLKHDDRPSGSKGPSDEMWKLDEPSIQKLPRSETKDNTSNPENATVKRNGKSLWNIFADIVRLRWSPRSESHSSGRKTGGRNSPNQSTSSETWFSGHEAEENEGTSITQGLSGRHHQEEKTHSQFEEGSCSSTSEGNLKNVGINAPSSSVVLEGSEGKLGNTSSAAIGDSSIASPALRLRRSPAVRGALETEEANSSNSSVSIERPESVVNEGELKQRNKLQRRDQVVHDRFDEWEEAYRVEAEQRKIDEMFMREALLEAQKAAGNWEVPVGAVLVHNGKIIARGCNLVEELLDSTAHAEMICIREASNVLRSWRLSETTLYVTLEPCPMCAGAILQARIDTVVWGAPNKLLGADGSWIRLFPNGDGENNGLEQSDKPAAPVHPFHPKIIVRRGVMASECADTMQQFFKLRRKKDKKPETTPSAPPSCLPITHRPSKFLAKMHDAFSLMFCL